MNFAIYEWYLEAGDRKAVSGKGPVVTKTAGGKMTLTNTCNRQVWRLVTGDGRSLSPPIAVQASDKSAVGCLLQWGVGRVPSIPAYCSCRTWLGKGGHREISRQEAISLASPLWDCWGVAHCRPSPAVSPFLKDHHMHCSALKFIENGMSENCIELNCVLNWVLLSWIKLNQVDLFKELSWVDLIWTELNGTSTEQTRPN